MFQAPSEVEGWQTYRNDEYGFEVKYPNDWLVFVETNNGSGAVTILANPVRVKAKRSTRHYEGFRGDVMVYYYKNILEHPGNIESGVNASTLQEFVQKHAVILDSKQITAAGYPAYELTHSGLDPYYSLVIDKKGEIFEIILADAFWDSKTADIQKEVLSTFRFVE